MLTRTSSCLPNIDLYNFVWFGIKIRLAISSSALEIIEIFDEHFSFRRVSSAYDRLKQSLCSTIFRIIGNLPVGRDNAASNKQTPTCI